MTDMKAQKFGFFKLVKFSKKPRVRLKSANCE